MNKTELVAAVAEKTGQTKADVDTALKGLIDAITENVASGDGEVTIPGFMSVKRIKREAREAWNPAKGERVWMEASNGVRISAGSKLKASVKSA